MVESPIVNAGTTFQAYLNQVDADQATAKTVADVGDGGTFTLTNDACVALTTGGAETRTLAVPAYVGQELVLFMDSDGGDAVVTLTSGGAGGESTLTYSAEGQSATLRGVTSGGSLLWAVHLAEGAPAVA